MSRRREQRHTVREMREGPSKLPCRGRFQTAISCYGPRRITILSSLRSAENLVRRSRTETGEPRGLDPRHQDPASVLNGWQISLFVTKLALTSR